DRSPALAETLLVGVTVLRDDGGDPLGVVDSEPEACRRAVVEDVYCKPIEADDLGKAVDDARDVVEGIAECLTRRHVGLTKSGKVRRNDRKSVGKERDQIPEHVARAREAMQQQELWRMRGPCFAIENLETVDIGRAIPDGLHRILLYL